MTYEVIVSPLAETDLKAITDVRTRNAIIRKAFELDHEPDKQGKPLSGDLATYRAVRAAGQRYRIIYEVETVESVVTVVVVGIRKEGDKRDAYRVANKRLGK